jgi:hypothetical protein
MAGPGIQLQQKQQTHPSFFNGKEQQIFWMSLQISCLCNTDAENQFSLTDS